jgi:hypothetical protein
LKRALAMSVDPSMEVDPPSYNDDGTAWERRIRATAPPPSPTEKRGQLIGPVNQQRDEGNENSLALMPASMIEVRCPTVTL